MNTERDWMISIDDHLIEPPNLWQSRLPKKYLDVGPRVERIDGLDQWRYEDTQVAMSGITNVVGRPREDWSLAPVNFEDLHPACSNPIERAKAMDDAGILAQANFPSYPRFCGQIFLEAKDKELALLGVQAWNDFILDEWCGAAPGRTIPLAMVPLWDPTLAAREVERAAAKGAKGIIFSENVSSLGQPSIHDAGRYWDPFLSVANETGMPICMHIGSSSKLPATSPDAPTLLSFALGPMNAIATLTDWVYSGVFFRFPNIKIALSEGEIGWMPFILQWLDRQTERQEWAEKTDFFFNFEEGDFTERDTINKVVDRDVPPSQLFRDHIYGCFIEDAVGVRNLDLIGEDNVMMETDFPHSDGTWPDCIKIAQEQVAPLDDVTAVKLLRGNACRVFQFEPAPVPERVAG
jgi:predicted TIM-barrel fold metal-dependent hydrolase